MEFKYRIIYTVIGYIVTIFVVYFNMELIIERLSKPLIAIGVGPLMYTDLLEPIKTSIWLSIVLSTFLILPLIAFHLFSFLVPALYPNQSSLFSLSLRIFLVLFFLLLFLYLEHIWPLLVNFFLFFNSDPSLFLNLKLSTFVHFFLQFFYSLLILLFLPFLLLLFPLSTIAHHRLILLFLSYSFLALLTPPDLFSFLFFIFFFTLLFEFFVFLSCLLVSAV